MKNKKKTNKRNQITREKKKDGKLPNEFVKNLIVKLSRRHKNSDKEIYRTNVQRDP